MKKQTVLQFTKRFAALAGAAVLTAVTAFGGSAAAAGTYTMDVARSEKFTLNKYLVMEKTANVPAATFTFTLSADGVTEDTDGAAPVYKGVAPESVTWNSTAGNSGTITFTAGAATNVTKDNTIAALSDYKTDEDHKYATGSVELDFSGCGFDKPGVYRYALTETDDATEGMTYDSTTRYLDVYVEDADPTNAGTDLKLKITKYVMHKTADADLSFDSGEQLSYGADFAKSEGFVNVYEAEELTIKHTTAGNQGDKTKAFTYTLKIENVEPNSKFVIDPSNIEGLALSNSTGAVDTTTGTLTALNGAVEVTFKMAHNDTVKVKGLPIGAQYTVMVDKVDYKAQVVTGTTPSATSNNTVTETVAKDKADVTFTLTKAGTIPTGVIMTVAPFAAVTLLGAAGIAGVTRKKKHEDEEV